MDEIGKYILSIGIAALITGILTGFTDSKSATGVLLRMVSGLFLCIIAVRPLVDLNLSYLTGFVDTFEESAQTATAVGTSMADDALRQIIKTETEAYILDKATLYGLQLEVQVTLTDDAMPVPESVRLTGSASPYAKSRLQTQISNDLGIPKEQQLWTG